MNTSNKGTAFLKEFRDFIAFLQSLWGILAGISALFPLSNVFTKIIPLKDGKLFSHELTTVITMVITFFFILWMFGQRQKFKTYFEANTESLRRKARRYFVVGIVSLISYLVVYSGIILAIVLGWAVDLVPHNVWGIIIGDLIRMLFEVISLVLYSGFFALMTRAFMLLGMIEFFGHES